MKEDVRNFAIKQGLPTPKFLMHWKGYDVYDVPYPVIKLKDGMEIYPTIGIPQYLLDKDGKVRVTSYDEGFEIMRLQPEIK